MKKLFVLILICCSFGSNVFSCNTGIDSFRVINNNPSSQMFEVIVYGSKNCPCSYLQNKTVTQTGPNNLLLDLTYQYPGTPCTQQIVSFTDTIPLCAPYGLNGSFVLSTNVTNINTWAPIPVASVANTDTVIFALPNIPSIVLTSCNPIVLNNQTYTQNTMDTIAYMGSTGCDSLHIYDISINNSSSTINPTVCNDYLSPSNNYTWSNSGTYSDTVLNANGCDSVITINLVVNAANIAVIQNGINLTAQASPAMYQWIDCNGNVPILGATSQTYIPASNGNYAVVVTQNDCTDTSVCYIVNSVGIDNIKFLHLDLEISPNPISNQFSIRLDKKYHAVRVTIKDLSGKIVKSINTENFEYGDIYFNASPGVYTIEVQAGDKRHIQKIIKR